MSENVNKYLVHQKTTFTKVIHLNLKISLINILHFMKLLDCLINTSVYLPSQTCCESPKCLHRSFFQYIFTFGLVELFEIWNFHPLLVVWWVAISYKLDVKFTELNLSLEKICRYLWVYCRDQVSPWKQRSERKRHFFFFLTANRPIIIIYFI